MKRRALSLIVPVAITTLVIGAGAFGWLERLELMTVDLRYNISRRINPAPITVVAIDQDSLKSVGVWPWPRSYYADVIRAVTRGRARGILVDLDLSSVSKDPGEDDELVNSVRQSGIVVLSAHIKKNSGGDGMTIRSLSLPFGDLAQAAKGIGGIVFNTDLDGVVRRSPPPISFGDSRYPPLGVVGARMIGADARGDASGKKMIRFSLPDVKDIPVVSFVDVREGRVQAGLFKGRVVLIGAIARELRDLWRTPLGIIPGVFIHAEVVKSSLNNSWYFRNGPVSGFLLVLIFSSFLWFCLKRMHWKAATLIILSYLAVVCVTGIVLLEWNVMLDVVPLLLVGMLQYPINLSVQLLGSERFLAHERMKAEAILKLGELEGAENAGQKPYLVPLVLLRQIMHVDQISLFLPEGNGDDGPKGWSEERVAGEESSRPDPWCLNEAMTSSGWRRGAGTPPFMFQSGQ